VVVLTGAVIAQNGQEVPLVNIPGRNGVNNLPSANTIRWTIWRKAEVVAAVRNGLLGLDEACERYRLSAEEFLNWQRLIEDHGLRGLLVTRIQDYRQAAEKNRNQCRLDQPPDRITINTTHYSSSGTSCPKCQRSLFSRRFSSS